ncbi:dual specificity protein phosphatase 23-like [Strongylocentrotus purpuratus]|uniref:Dual specificity protein phosphatase 23 n=1 Tax=Strongylocentrotus purpuratus TaxID=7668 RepID=A0A7M7NR27_STRPU|nr:dual specificity protein phosphatase 23-like [Strongylocentrotus purpuratus]
MSQTTPPPFFTWVSSNLAAHGMPSCPDQMRYLADNGIRYLVSLTTECRPPVEATPNVTWVPIGIDDYHPPTLEQVVEFMRVMEEAEEKNEAVSVHCLRGRGRTGTMVACYFIKMQKMSAAEAIAEVRHQRPGSVETVEQENLIRDYETFINKPSI